MPCFQKNQFAYFWNRFSEWFLLLSKVTPANLRLKVSHFCFNHNYLSTAKNRVLLQTLPCRSCCSLLYEKVLTSLLKYQFSKCLPVLQTSLFSKTTLPNLRFRCQLKKPVLIIFLFCVPLLSASAILSSNEKKIYVNFFEAALLFF